METKIIKQNGKSIQVFAMTSVDSTNEECKQPKYLNIISPIVIVADTQTAGRGQQAKVWDSQPGGFYLSFRIPKKKLPKLKLAISPLICGQIVARWLQETLALRVKLKWPNDIYVKDKKVAGTLIQNTLTANKFQSAVVGIGINVNQQEFLSDAPNPTSFKMETGDTFDLDEMAKELCWAVEKRYLQLRSTSYLAAW